MRYVIAIIACLTSLGCHYAAAADVAIENDIPSNFGSGAKEAIAEIVGTKVGDQHSATETTFTLTLPPASAIATLSLTLPAGKTGFADYDQKFSIPFYQKTLNYYPSVVANDASDKSVYDFLADASSKRSAVDLFRFNQRARVLFEERNIPGRAPIPEDASVAYWLVQSTGALVSKAGIVIDPETSAAATKLADWTASHGRFEKSFFSKNPGITSDTVAFALKALRNVTAVFALR
ncbi:hypothetical protein ACQZ6F_29400 [Rhizobium sp. A22-96]